MQALKGSEGPIYETSIDDPRDHEPEEGFETAGTDIKSIRSTFDASTGTWRTTLSFYGPVDPRFDTALLRASLELGRGCHQYSRSLNAWTSPRSKTVGMDFRERTGRRSSVDRKSLLLVVQDRRLIGKRPCYFIVERFSRGNIDYDTIPGPLAFKLRR